MTMDLDLARQITGGVSAPSKMPCYAFAIDARLCKKGSKLRKIANSVCSKCYAMRGNYARTNVRKAMVRYLEGVLHPLWVMAMTVLITRLEFSGYFRWFSSGDLQSMLMLVKIAKVCENTPHIKHWLATKEDGFVQAFLDAGFKIPPNLIIRLSAAPIDVMPPKDVLKRLGIKGSAVVTDGSETCKAFETKHECQLCRKCWDKRHTVISYKLH